MKYKLIQKANSLGSKTEDIIKANAVDGSRLREGIIEMLPFKRNTVVYLFENRVNGVSGYLLWRGAV